MPTKDLCRFLGGGVGVIASIVLIAYGSAQLILGNWHMTQFGIIIAVLWALGWIVQYQLWDNYQARQQARNLRHPMLSGQPESTGWLDGLAATWISLPALLILLLMI